MGFEASKFVSKTLGKSNFGESKFSGEGGSNSGDGSSLKKLTYTAWTDESNVAMTDESGNEIMFTS